ncbi:hypothetical protein D7V90_08330 [bacterium 1xD42-87]|nr:hypothetical protein D7V90_08330 [bacterium 1xD42-87]
MDIVKLNVYAEAYYSGATYEEDIVISKSLYEKIKTNLDEYDSENNENARGIYVGELDGKHSEVEGELSVEIYSEDEVADCSWDLNEDGDMLYYKIKDICDEKDLDLDKDIENVKEYLKNVDSYVEICIRTKKSNVDKIKEYAESLEQK